MLKILHVYQSASFSGAEAYALEVAQYHALSNDVTFLAADDSPLSKKISAKASAENAAAPRLELETRLAKLDLTSFDLVVLHSTQELKAHWPRLAFAKLKARLRKCKSPKIVLYTHIWISHSKKDPIHAIPYAVLDCVWCSSEQSKQALVKFLPVAANKIEIVRYGRNTAAFDAALLTKEVAREKLGLPVKATVVGTLARVDQGKGSRELFEAVTDLMQTRGDLHFLMIGPPTDGDPKATEVDQELHRSIGKMAPTVRARIHKIGRLEGGSHYLTAFDLFVLATYKENFALTLLEALYAKKHKEVYIKL